MRYLDSPTIIYTDINGKTYPVKDTLPIRTFQTGTVIKKEKDLMLDELISRKELYGEETEDLTWAVVDHNIEAIVEADFDIGKLASIKIPIVEAF
jgi:hypothetical protein